MLLTEAHLRKTTNIRNSYTVAMMCMQSTVVSHTLKTLATCDKGDYNIAMTMTFRILTELVCGLFTAAYSLTIIIS